MPLIQPASVLLSDQAAISVGSTAATLNAPIWAHACAAHIATTPRFNVIGPEAQRRANDTPHGACPASR